jgi:hypothetical protein
VDVIAESLKVNGQYRPIVTTRDGTILAGNHTFLAAGKLGWTSLSCVVLDVEPGSPEAHRIMLADNRTADLGGYDTGLLYDLLSVMETSESGLLGTGYVEGDLDALNKMVSEGITTYSGFLDDEDGEDGEDGEDDGGPRERVMSADRGTLLSITDLAYGDPVHTCQHGDRWKIGHHVLHVRDPHREWAHWAPDLKPGCLFAPYPEPYLTLTDTARATPLVLVQPSLLLAGMLIDKHCSIFGEEEAIRL